MHVPFSNRYVSLGTDFYAEARPTPVKAPGLIQFNAALAATLGISTGDAEVELAEIFSGNTLPAGAAPLAMAYAGHQFGHFNPQLGDGRAILLGEVEGADTVSWSIQLKGAGRTFFSRNGDGRAALGPVLREYLVSEAMHRLNVPTTRALAAVTTGEPVVREQLIPGGVITRVATSFVRVGSFQYFSARGHDHAVQQLADHVIAQNYPEVRDADNPYAALLTSIVERQAALIARWMQLGFIHGVMNTDNMSIAGETIDYGPCAFIDDYSHDQVFSSIDREGRYAYRNQPAIALWNLSRLAESLLPLLDENREAAISQAHEILHGFIERYESAWLAGFRAKLGLAPGNQNLQEEDRTLIENLLNIMDGSGADFTLTFYHLSRMSSQPTAVDEELRTLFTSPRLFDEWITTWRRRLAEEQSDDARRQQEMQAVNPVYIPRNHRIEAVIRAAEDQGDLAPFHELHEVLQRPFEEQPGRESYMQPPQPAEVVEHTFCGT